LLFYRWIWKWNCWGLLSLVYVLGLVDDWSQVLFTWCLQFHQQKHGSCSSSYSKTPRCIMYHALLPYGLIGFLSGQQHGKTLIRTCQLPFLTSVIRRNLQPVRSQERLAKKSRIQLVLQICPRQLLINLATAVVETGVTDLEELNTTRTRSREKKGAQRTHRNVQNCSVSLLSRKSTQILHGRDP
jgi:hypothetical protein